MIRFPALDADGIAYRINLWSELTGGIPVLVGVPARPDLDEQAVQAEVVALATGLAAALGASISSVIRHESTSGELELSSPEAP